MEKVRNRHFEISERSSRKKKKFLGELPETEGGKKWPSGNGGKVHERTGGGEIGDSRFRDRGEHLDPPVLRSKNEMKRGVHFEKWK